MFSRRTRATVAIGGSLAMALAVSSCSSRVEPAVVENPGALSAVEIPEGRVADAVDALDGIAANAMSESGIPGMAIAVVHEGEVVFTEGFGVADVDTGAPVNADTAFQLASVSKPIGATVVASVVGTGEVAWDDPVVEHYPEFALSDPYVTANATIGDMYSMRSGLPHQAGDDLEELGYNRSEIIERFRLLPLEPFRNQSLYTNFGLTAGAEATARAVGVPWEELSKTRLYEPLGMTRTTSLYEEFMATDNRATLHTLDGDQWVANGNRQEQAQAPAGQVSSTANDMSKWMLMWLAAGEFEGEQVVDSAAFAESLVPRIEKGSGEDPLTRPSSYGYGIGINTDPAALVRYQFSGAYSQGAATHVTFLPAEDLGIAVLTNALPVGVAEAVAAEFLDVVEYGYVANDWLTYYKETFTEAIGLNEPAPEPPANPAPPQPLSAYVGTYANAYYGPATVSLDQAGQLTATIGPTQLVLPLTPWDGDVFATEGEGGVLVPAVEFTVVDGQATELQFASLQAPGQEVFVRQ